MKAGGVHDVPQCGLSVGKMRTVELAANDFVPSLAVFGGISGAFRCGFAGLPELAFAQVPPGCNPSTKADLHLRGGGRHSSAPSRAPSRKETTSRQRSTPRPSDLVWPCPHEESSTEESLLQRGDHLLAVRLLFIEQIIAEGAPQFIFQLRGVGGPSANGLEEFSRHIGHHDPDEPS